MTKIKWEVWFRNPNGLPILYCSYNDDGGNGEMAAEYKKENLIYDGYLDVEVKKVEVPA